MMLTARDVLLFSLLAVHVSDGVATEEGIHQEGSKQLYTCIHGKVASHGAYTVCRWEDPKSPLEL